jgi:hypothetical protein
MEEKENGRMERWKDGRMWQLDNSTMEKWNNVKVE